MRTIRFRLQGADNRWFDSFGDSLENEIPNLLRSRGWQVATPITITRPNGWTGLTSLIFEFQVAVYDSYPNDYITNENIKEQLRSDLSSIMRIDWITMPALTDIVGQDTGGFIFDQANTDAIAKKVGEFAIPTSIIVMGVIALLVLRK